MKRLFYRVDLEAMGEVFFGAWPFFAVGIGALVIH